MPQKPALKDETGHAYPNGHIWLYFTVVLFVLALPALIIFNVITQGSELVPALQPTFHPNNTNLEAWWGTRHLPEQLRPGLPQCQPQALGRGDNFRLSASMFDYTVMSTWNTSHPNATEQVQEQERVEYHGESFADCSVSTARYDYSLSERTHSVTVGVLCPGYEAYPVAISMQTTMTFAWEVTRDFIGQYYGAGLDLMDITKSSNYRQPVLAALEVIAADALTIAGKTHLPVPPLSMRVYFQGIDDTFALLPDRTTASTLTYVNGSQPDPFPNEASIYSDSVYNLVYVAIDAVNLDLGNIRAPNMFRNGSRLNEVVYPNLPPSGINSSDWAAWGQSIYYGRIPSPYRTWAEMLLDGQPTNITLGNLEGLPTESVMITSYLCPIYQIKPLKSLLSSVFIGSAAMTSSAWGGWLILVALLAKGQLEPRAKCQCDDCKQIEDDLEKERARKAANPGLIGKILAPFRRTKHAVNSRDLERSQLPSLAHRADSGQSDSSAKKSA